MEFQNPSFLMKIFESDLMTMEFDEDSSSDSTYYLCINGQKSMKVLIQDQLQFKFIQISEINQKPNGTHYSS
jgi:hypothetical protein